MKQLYLISTGFSVKLEMVS